VDPEKLKGRLTSFWILHISGWLAYAVSTIWLGYRGPWTDLPGFLLYFVPYVVGFLTCLPLRYAYRGLQFHKYPLPYSVLTGVAASFAAANVWLGIDLVINLFVHQPPYLRSAVLQKVYLLLILRRGIPLLGWTLLYLGIKTWKEWKEQETRTEKANALAQTAQLQMLRYQLNPHFLFNAMNSIRALIDEDEAKARELITELSEFLRYSLDSKDYADVPLKTEIEAIRHYFAIQKKRYEDKLAVTYDIEPQAAEYPVLSFLIHPLVENAVKYGMRTSTLPLKIELKATVNTGALLIEVSNTGRWVKTDDQERLPGAGTGTGLENVRSRLENAFPGRHRIGIVEKDGWVRIQLEIGKLHGPGEEKSL
jgi:signal transduction histidine kinase